MILHVGEMALARWTVSDLTGYHQDSQTAQIAKSFLIGRGNSNGQTGLNGSIEQDV